MSQENVELRYRAEDAFNRRDIEGLLEFVDPDAEAVPYERAVEGGGAYQGHSGIRRWMEESVETVPDLRSELEEVRDLGDVTLGHGRVRGHGATSGASFERPLWEVMWWRDGRIFRWNTFDTGAEALEAAGLSE